ncbi:MAG TPA: hypothetical protein VE011_04360 [Candidatus Dormibacteraeota bacterium]|nr:hypothetical protein [Candidatus Dormibacteraeota bacterium]
MHTRLTSLPARAAAVVWLDGKHALIARAHEGHSVITEVGRDADPETQYLLRVLHEAEGCDRLAVMGSDPSRIALEREYVALYRRPDRLIDLGPSSRADREEIVDQLRVVEPALG